MHNVRGKYKSDKANTLPTSQGLNLVNKIGSGSIGSVYRGINDRGEERAYKIFGSEDSSNIERTTDPAFVIEAGIYKYLGNRNPGICNVDEIGQGYISMSLAEGDLSKEMRSDGYVENVKGVKQSKVYPLSSCLLDMLTLLVTVDLLHGENVGHFDIKPRNIVRGKDGKLRLCDLGSASILSEELMVNFTLYSSRFARGIEIDISDLAHINSRRTPKYQAPETYVRADNNSGKTLMYPAADIWSLGVLFLEMLTGYNFFTSMIRKDSSGRIYVDIGSYINGPTSFMDRFTEDMNRDGFEVYVKDWERAFRNLSLDEMSNVSPYNLIVQEQSSLVGQDNISTQDIKSVWEMIKGMLEPNPLRRLSARSCLDRLLLIGGRDMENILDDFYEEYERRVEYTFPSIKDNKLYDSFFKRPVKVITRFTRPDSHYIGDIFMDIMQIPFIKGHYTKLYAFLKEDTLLASRLKRMLLVLDYKIGSKLDPGISKLDKQLIHFCTMILASYAEYSSRTRERPSIETNNMKYRGNMENIYAKFISEYSSQNNTASLQDMIYTMTYFLLVEVFEFDIWI